MRVYLGFQRRSSLSLAVGTGEACNFIFVAQKTEMMDISNYLGLKLHDFELLRQTVELLIHIHHSYWTVCLLASCQIHFLKSQQHNLFLKR